MTDIYIGLVHYPVYNKSGEVITSGITNLDVHDISRSALSYNVKNYFLIHPNQRQKEIFNQILSFWKTEMAAFYNQHRVDALSVIKFAKSIDESVNLIKNQENNHPIIITTTAQTKENQISFSNLRKLIKSSQRPIYLLFGTGNGLCEEILNNSDYILSPIQAKSKYNHLSVRSAVAIVLDRLLSEEYKEE